MPDFDDELISSDSVYNEHQQKTRIDQVFSMAGCSGESARAPSTSAMSTSEHGMNTPQPCCDPFIQLVNDGYNGIQNKKIRRKLQQKILNEIANA